MVGSSFPFEPSESRPLPTPARRVVEATTGELSDHQVFVGSCPKFRGADPAPILVGRRLEMNRGIMFSVKNEIFGQIRN
jgi:hypothetical protein